MGWSLLRREWADVRCTPRCRDPTWRASSHWGDWRSRRDGGAQSSTGCACSAPGRGRCRRRTKAPVARSGGQVLLRQRIDGSDRLRSQL